MIGMSILGTQLLNKKFEMTRERSNKNVPLSSSGDENIDFPGSDVFHSPSVALHKIYDSITESLFLYEEFYRSPPSLPQHEFSLAPNIFIEISNSFLLYYYYTLRALILLKPCDGKILFE